MANIVVARFIVLGAISLVILPFAIWLAARLLQNGGAALNSLLKHLFVRTRPDLFRVVEATGYSFPSGHAMVSLCFYGMLAFFIVRNIKSLRWRLVIISLAVLLVVAIGISRIYLGVHYPTDVIAGYTAGAMWLFFRISLLAWWEQRRAANQELYIDTHK